MQVHGLILNSDKNTKDCLQKHYFFNQIYEEKCIWHVDICLNAFRVSKLQICILNIDFLKWINISFMHSLIPIPCQGWGLLQTIRIKVVQ